MVILLRRQRRRRRIEKQDLRRKMAPNIPPPLTGMGVVGHEAWAPRPEMAVTHTVTMPMTLTGHVSSRGTGSGMPEQQQSLPFELATTNYH
jgi:hypothetical protein